MRYYGNGGFIFAWDLGIIFLGIPNLMIGWFLGKFFRFWRRHGKMCRLFPCIPIFGVFLIKKRGMRDILRKHINTLFCCVLMVKKGICKKGPLVRCNTHYLLRFRAKFQTAIVSCLRFIWIANSSDHRRVWYQIWKIILLLKYIS